MHMRRRALDLQERGIQRGKPCRHVSLLLLVVNGTPPQANTVETTRAADNNGRARSSPSLSLSITGQRQTGDPRRAADNAADWSDCSRPRAGCGRWGRFEDDSLELGRLPFLECPAELDEVSLGGSEWSASRPAAADGPASAHAALSTR